MKRYLLFLLPLLLCGCTQGTFTRTVVDYQPPFDASLPDASVTMVLDALDAALPPHEDYPDGAVPYDAGPGWEMPGLEDDEPDTTPPPIEAGVPDSPVPMCVIYPGLYRWRIDRGACPNGMGSRARRNALGPVIDGLTGPYYGFSFPDCRIPITTLPGLAPNESVRDGYLKFVDDEGEGMALVTAIGGNCATHRDTLKVVPL